MSTIRPKTTTLIRTAAVLLGTVLCSASLANQSPTVSAGADDTVPIGVGYALGGQVDDDSTSPFSLTVSWRQISGPAHSEVYDSSMPQTYVTFSVIGTYVFALTAVDSQGLSASDTVTITAREPIPFEVLAPVNSQRVVKRQPFLIRWRNEGGKACRVYISFDSGATQEMISTEATYDSMWYDFDYDLPPGTPGLILVSYYPGAGPPNVVVSGSFVLVDTAVHAVNPGRVSPGAHSRQVSSNGIRLDNPWSPAGIALFDVRGRVIGAFNRPGSAGRTPRSSGFLVCRLAKKQGAGVHTDVQ